MKILNIDAFAEVKRTLVFKGVSHAVEEISVQGFIDNLKAAEALEAAGGDKTLSKSFEDAVVAIRQAIPTIPEDAVRGMKLPAMTAVMQFIRGDLDPVEKSAEGDVTEKKPS